MEKERERERKREKERERERKREEEGKCHVTNFDAECKQIQNGNELSDALARNEKRKKRAGARERRKWLNHCTSDRK